MNIKTKTIKTAGIVVFTTLIAVIASVAPVYGDINAGAVYLESKSSNPWATMALTAVGQHPDGSYLNTVGGSSAIELAAPIMAITSLGENPRTFAGRNFIAELKSYYDGQQLGDVQTLNDDIFGILALISAGGEENLVEINNIRDFVIANQNGDGGWSYSTGGSSDTNMTAAAMMALVKSGTPSSDAAILKAVSYLRAAQNDDGGFPYDPISPWGTGSDSSSDAWVISAVYTIGEDPNAWIKSGHNPVEHLLSLQTSGGYFEYQTGSGEDSFTPVSTAYAVIALAGFGYPVKTIDNTESNGEEDTAPVETGNGNGGASGKVAATYRIEGSLGQICSGEAEARDALNLVELAASDCEFEYQIEETSLGLYLKRIDEDEAVGVTGWLYLVNNTLPSIGAADYELELGDEVLWYFGEFGWPLLRISLEDANLDSGERAIILVEYRSGDGAWLSVEGANVYLDGYRYVTDSSGVVETLLSSGTYRVFAEKEGMVRSQIEKLTVRSDKSSTIKKFAESISPDSDPPQPLITVEPMLDLVPGVESEAGDGDTPVINSDSELLSVPDVKSEAGDGDTPIINSDSELLAGAAFVLPSSIGWLMPFLLGCLTSLLLSFIWRKKNFGGNSKKLRRIGSNH